MKAPVMDQISTRINERKKRVMNHVFDRSTIEEDKQTFLECIFGKGIKYVFEGLKRKPEEEE